MSALLALLLACGAEHWPEKTMTDPAAWSVSLEPRDATVAELAALPLDAERQAYRVRAQAIGAMLEADGDVHVVIEADGATMIAEFPAAECLHGSRVEKEANVARKAFVALLGSVGRKYRRLKRALTLNLVGVLFLDKLHGQRGAARNGAELHPVLSVQEVTDAR